MAIFALNPNAWRRSPIDLDTIIVIADDAPRRTRADLSDCASSLVEKRMSDTLDESIQNHPLPAQS